MKEPESPKQSNRRVNRRVPYSQEFAEFVNKSLSYRYQNRYKNHAGTRYPDLFNRVQIQPIAERCVEYIQYIFNVDSAYEQQQQYDLLIVVAFGTR